MAKALEAEHQGNDGDVAFARAYDAEVIQPGIAGAPAITHGLALLTAYRVGGVGVGKPEHRFRVYLPDRDLVPVPLVGVMDLAADDSVWEFKTGRTKWDQGRCDTSPQAAFYRYGFLREFGHKPQGVQFVVMHTGRVEVQRFWTYPAGPELRIFELQAAAVYRGIRDGKFPPLCKKCPACVAAGVGPVPVEPSGYPSLEWAT